MGFTRPLLKLFWANLQKRKVQEFKIQAALQGIKLPDKDEAAEKRKAIEENIKDPLRSFPNDVTYITAQDCDSKIRLSQKVKTRPQESQWDKYRKECCLGNYGVVALRCSINDVLWGRYLQIKEAGAELRLDQVKAMVEFDIVRRQLYPVGYKGTGNESPPTAHIETLKKTGEYTKILQKLDAISARIKN